MIRYMVFRKHYTDCYYIQDLLTKECTTLLSLEDCMTRLNELEAQEQVSDSPTAELPVSMP